jgi:hypothetical protein
MGMFGKLLIIVLAVWAIISAVLVVAGYGDSDGTKTYSYITFGAAPLVAILALLYTNK